MRLLLDTNVLLWVLTASQRLTEDANRAIADPENDVLFSTASILEVAIKYRLGRADFPIEPLEIARGAHQSGFRELPVSIEAAAMVADIPLHHRDPFDHLLIAQAMTEPALFYTGDQQLVRYSELVRLVF